MWVHEDDDLVVMFVEKIKPKMACTAPVKSPAALLVVTVFFAGGRRSCLGGHPNQLRGFIRIPAGLLSSQERLLPMVT